jgi:energy-converting hydrogenase Eha subunit E
LIAPVVAIIVGLHFLPLARWLPGPIYYLTGALLVVVGLAGAAVQEPTVRILTVCIGAAGVLWLSCAIVLRQNATRA